VGVTSVISAAGRMSLAPILNVITGGRSSATIGTGGLPQP
jgi:hypothetical protein